MINVTERFSHDEPISSPPMMRLVNFFSFIWCIYQLWIASPLQYKVAEWTGLSWLAGNDIQARSFHLAFGMIIGFLINPMIKGTKGIVKNADFIISVILSILSAISIFYLVFFYAELSQRAGLPTQTDIIMSIIGIVCLIECTRRSLSTFVACLSIVVLSYTYFGHNLTGVFSIQSQTIDSIASHQWLSSEGVFGVALDVSTSFIFLFVLFGTLLELTGAGDFFIALSYVILGRFSGGAAKACVVASAAMGMISGSSIANTMTVGAFTIPLMKKSGLTAEKAAAIEVSAGINGQVMPPIMGAAAFLMAEFLSIEYGNLIKYAFIPAILVYVALFIVVHIEFKKLPIAPISGFDSVSLYKILLETFAYIGGLIVVFLSIVFLIKGINLSFQSWNLNFIGIENLEKFSWLKPLILVGLYLATISYQSKYESLPLRKLMNEGNLSTKTLGELMRSGIHFFIPVFVLIWCLMIDKLSPQYSAYWTILFLFFMVLTEEPIKSFLRKESGKSLKNAIWNSFKHLFEALTKASKNMVTIAIATATAGIIVGTVSLTGIGDNIAEIVSSLSNDNLFVALCMTAFTSMILGLGMPTTACYIIVSSLMVPVVGGLIAAHDMHIPLLSIHLFVFYFGLLADVTPPIGLASYAAAAIAGSNPTKTSVMAFMYNIRTMIIPFIFVFNSDLLLFNVSFAQAIPTIVGAFLAIFCITVALQNFLIIKNAIYENALLIVAFVFIAAPEFSKNLFQKESRIFTQQSFYEQIQYDASVYNFDKELILTFRPTNCIEKPPAGKILSRILLSGKHDNVEDTISILDLLKNYNIQTEVDQSGATLVTNVENSPIKNKSLFGLGCTMNLKEVALPIVRTLDKFDFRIIGYLMIGLVYLSQKIRQSSKAIKGAPSRPNESIN